MTDWRAAFESSVAKALEKQSSQPPSGDPDPTKTSPLPNPTDAVIRAAITDTFRLTRSKTSDPDDIVAGDEETAVVAHAVAVIIGGQRRLRLTNEARAAILGKAVEMPRFKQLLEAASYEDSDEEVFDVISADPSRQANAWLRAFLVSNVGDIHQAPPDELRAALTARESLARCAVPANTPSVEDLRRALSYAELLEPLCVLIGAEGGWEGRVAQDRFVGRNKELAKLRSFVDELDSATFGESIRRGVARGAETAAGWLGLNRASLLTVIARGGMGKSALIAKFVLQHAVRHSATKGDQRTFPFAYLDFDRATVRTTDSRLLLLEVLRQLSFQYPAAEESLGALSESLRSTLGGALAQDSDPYAELRQILRTHAKVGDRRFLLVLDTFEVVQFDQQSVEAVDSFLLKLIGNEGFPQLRIVVAGREVLGPRMLFPAQVAMAPPLSLLPLNVTDAIEMANRLGASLMKKEWSSRWARRIAGKATEDKSGRREPLSIRVAVDLLKSESPGKRDELSLEIKERGEKAHASFVGTLYQRRVLGHVQGGSDVGKLAWPGLIFRNVTREIVREVLGPLCGLTPEAGDVAFDLLEREVWLVDVVDEPTGKTLRHKRELRARTLPLMRRYKPPASASGARSLSFDDVNKRAIDYFGAHCNLPGAYAEWIYHRLLAGEKPEDVDESWTDDCRTRLSDAAFDFDSDQRAHLYLLSKTSERLATPQKLADMRKAGAWIAFDHVERVAPELGDFDDLAIRPEVVELAKVQREKQPEPEDEAVRWTILAKIGRWNIQPPDVVATSPWAPQVDFARRYLRAHDGPYDISETESDPRAVPSHDAQTDAYRRLAQDLAASAISGNVSYYQHLDEKLSYHIEDMRFATLRLDRGSLRVAAIFGNRSWTPAARLLLGTAVKPLTCSGAELRMIVDATDLNFVAHVLPQQERLIAGALETKGPLRIESLNLGKLLSETYEATLTKGVQPIRKFFSLRREDWITVFGYACARAVPAISKRQVELIKERLDQYASHSGRSWRSFWGTPNERWDLSGGADFISLMRIADEASDLPGMARLVESSAKIESPISEAAAADLRRLLRSEKAWGGHIDRLAEVEGTDSKERPPLPGPIIVPNDQQKSRWGGLAERDGRRLSVKLTDTESSRWTYQFDVVVEATDGELVGPAVFHLHESFPRSVIHIRRVQEKRRCVLYEVRASGAFTIGAQVRRSNGEWVGLELDLAHLSELPEFFRNR